MGGVGALPTFGNDATLSGRVRPAHRRQGVRPVRHEGLLPDAGGLHRAGGGAVPVPDGVHGHHRDDPDRRDGRALEASARSCSSASSSRRSSTRSIANWVWGGGWLSQLGMNFGLGHGHVDFAGSSVVHMTGGVTGLVRREDARAAHRQVRPGRQGAADPGAQHPDGRARHVHPRVRLVRLQPGLDAGGHGHAHRDRRGQHHARVGGGRVRRVSVAEVPLRQARRRACCATACSPGWWRSPRRARS